MNDIDRFNQCFTCEFLDQCNEDSDDEEGSCTRYIPDEEWVGRGEQLKDIFRKMKEMQND